MKYRRGRTDVTVVGHRIGQLLSGLLLTLAFLIPFSAAAAPTSTTLAVSPTSSTYGEVVTLTATVASSAGTPSSGGVTFYDGTQVIGASGVYSGVATTQVTTINAGNRSITARYNGDGDFEDSVSAPVLIAVNKAATSITHTVSPTSSYYGEVVILTATVSSPAGAPSSGSVTFYDGEQEIAGAFVYDGIATAQSNIIQAGSRSISAQYAFADNFDDSESAPVVIEVSKGATSTVLTSSSNPSLVGQNVTLRATVSNTSSLMTYGTVTFYDGPAVIGTKQLNMGSGSAELTTNSLISGNHALRAEYFGNTNFSGSVSPIVTQVVKNRVTVALSRSAAEVRPMDPVTFTVNVRSPAGTPSGTVTFLENNVALQTVALTAGTAQWTTTTLGYGPRSIAARYNGAPQFIAASSPYVPVLVTYALGSPLKLNTGAAYRQTRPSVAGVADGGAVIAWENQTQVDGPLGIMVRRMSVDGVLGPEIVVANPAAGVGSPSVAGLANGDFAVVWQAGAAGRRSIYLRLYAPNGSPRGVLQRVNIPVTRDNSLARVAPIANGAFIVVWQAASASGTGADIHARRFNSAGVPAAAQFLVNTTVIGEQTAPVVAQLPNGNSVIAWPGTVSGGYAPFFQLYLPNGARSGTERRASPEVMSALPRIAASPIATAAIGAFVLAWERPWSAASTSPDVYLQRYTAAGVAAGATIRLDPMIAGTQADPSLAVINGNHLVTAWTGVVGTDPRRMESAQVQLFRSNGTRLYVPFPVNYDPNDLERRPSVAAYNGSRNFVIAWSDVVYGGATGDVFIQRFQGFALAGSSTLDNIVSSGLGNQAPSLANE